MAMWQIVLGQKVVATFRCQVYYAPHEVLWEWKRQFPGSYFPNDLRAVRATAK